MNSCPNELCDNNLKPVAKWFVKIGYYKPKTTNQKTLRYKCKSCGKSFSNRTNKINVNQKKPEINQLLFIAYNQKQNIWIEDSLYSKYFNENTTGSHIVFAYTLVKALEQRKLALHDKAKKTNQTLTTDEDNQIEYFGKKGSSLLLVAAISACLEIFAVKKISNLYRLSFGEKTSTKEAIKI